MPHPGLQHAKFCYAIHGDGAGATVLQGWAELVGLVEEDVGLDEDLLADTDSWEMDCNGLPFSYRFAGEDFVLQIYRL